MLSTTQKKYLLYFFIGLIFLLLVAFLVYFFIIKPNPDLSMVSGTEYISGEEGQVIIRLQDSAGNPLSNANCKVSLLYPDKSFFLLEQQMNPTSVPGNYYTAFITPSNEGVYEEHIKCNVGTKVLFVSSSFHVSTGLNLVAKIFEKQQEQYQKIIADFIVTQELLQNNLGNLSSRLDALENGLNSSMEENQANFLNKFSKMGNAMEEIFGNSSTT